MPRRIIVDRPDPNSIGQKPSGRVQGPSAVVRRPYQTVGFTLASYTPYQPFALSWNRSSGNAHRQQPRTYSSKADHTLRTHIPRSDPREGLLACDGSLGNA